MVKPNLAELARWPDCDPRIAAQAIADTAAADRCALVLFTPRSGSSWLTGIVSATQQLGFLEEYINPAFIDAVAKAMCATSHATLIAMLQRWAKTANGVFSMEALAVEIALFGETEFFQAFGDNAVVFFLWRDDIVAQGVSLYRAVTTKRYHSTDAPAIAPEYDADQITEWMLHIVAIENENLALLERRGLRARSLRYEDIVRDRATTLAIFAAALCVELTAEQCAVSGKQDLQKIADEWNYSAIQRFRDERCEFVREIEAQRRIRRL